MLTGCWPKLKSAHEAWFPFIHFAHRWRNFPYRKYLGIKYNLHFLRVPAKNYSNIWTSNANRAKDIFRSVLLVSPLRACLMQKIFIFINVHVTQERSLIGFAVRKFGRRSWDIWTSNANRAKDIFSSCLFVSPLCACPMRKISLTTSEKREWKPGLTTGSDLKLTTTKNEWQRVKNECNVSE